MGPLRPMLVKNWAPPPSAPGIADVSTSTSSSFHTPALCLERSRIRHQNPSQTFSSQRNSLLSSAACDFLAHRLRVTASLARQGHRLFIKALDRSNARLFHHPQVSNFITISFIVQFIFYVLTLPLFLVAFALPCSFHQVQEGPSQQASTSAFAVEEADVTRHRRALITCSCSSHRSIRYQSVEKSRCWASCCAILRRAR